MFVWLTRRLVGFWLMITGLSKGFLVKRGLGKDGMIGKVTNERGGKGGLVWGKRRGEGGVTSDFLGRGEEVIGDWAEEREKGDGGPGKG